MLIVIPLYIFDLGFQLSVAATAGLVFLLPKLENWTEKAKIKLPGLLKEGLLVSLAAQAATLPIIALTFKTFSLSSFVANLLIVPLIPFMLVLSLLALVASMIFLPAGQLFAYLAFPFLDFFILTVNLLSGFSWTNVKF
jgi:competence protein ComEC